MIDSIAQQYSALITSWAYRSLPKGNSVRRTTSSSRRSTRMYCGDRSEAPDGQVSGRTNGRRDWREACCETEKECRHEKGSVRPLKANFLVAAQLGSSAGGTRLYEAL